MFLFENSISGTIRLESEDENSKEYMKFSKMKEVRGANGEKYVLTNRLGRIQIANSNGNVIYRNPLADCLTSIMFAVPAFGIVFLPHKDWEWPKEG